MTGVGSEVGHGFPHLQVVREAVTAVYRQLSPETVGSYAASVAPVEVAVSDDEDLTAQAARIARVMVRHLRLPDARVTVRFEEMDLAAHVDLTEGPEYVVALNTRFGRHRRDIGAALAHEVMHVFLHRLGLAFPGTEDNEILTDTAAGYLGAGWLLLDAFREDALTSQKLGYLTPEEYGYVLAKRALVFDEDPRIWFTSPQAYEAYGLGLKLARGEYRRPPLAESGWAARRRYTRDRRRALSDAAGASGAGAAVPVDTTGTAYAFGGGPPADRLRVSFPCPVCHQRLRLPVRGRMRARCALCRTVLDCDT